MESKVLMLSKYFVLRVVELELLEMFKGEAEDNKRCRGSVHDSVLREPLCILLVRTVPHSSHSMLIFSNTTASFRMREYLEISSSIHTQLR
jgi:hypothetical protein